MTVAPDGSSCGVKTQAMIPAVPLPSREISRVRGKRMGLAGLTIALIAAVLQPGWAHAADLSVRDIASRLHRALPDQPVDLQGLDLSGLDLSGLDFKRAHLSGADLTATDLTGAHFAGADLSRVKLDRSTLIRADFTEAQLAGATLVLPAVSSTFDLTASDAPIFARADLSHARLLVRLQGADLRAVKLVDANLSPHENAQFNGRMLRTSLTACNLKGANLTGADLRGVSFDFADLSGADLTNADLTDADFTHADLTGATLSRANLTAAEFAGATLRDVVGLATARGRDFARNMVAEHR